MVVDGNRRWAREAGLADVGEGHRRGSTHVAEVLRWCAGLGIDNVTRHSPRPGSGRTSPTPSAHCSKTRS
ncbi:undecaprenyl diphosphate synthase family protein [Amycolatopsis sp. YIM 10]|uniref:undecaprenyl diphosphate synthase family protein n=1 Tax=Amycolatopsis sp. YIM 10 TaxID=2653857 RepID=UPI00128FF2D2|nr:undecaprenyl diphosphate synthase family protein [Amycolatopsis sp. YIM 10]